MRSKNIAHQSATVLRALLRVLAVVLCLVATGCVGPTKAKNAPREIVYWTGWSGHEFDVQQKLVDEFNRMHPQIRVRLLSQFGISGYQKVRIAFAGGATPDVMSTVWADELASYSMRGVLTPLDDFLKKSGRDVRREYSPGVARMLQVEDKTYAMAVTTNAHFIAYNKTIFREAGLDPNRPPRTIAELDKAAKACTQYDARGNFVRYGFRPGNLAEWALIFGGQWYDPKTRRVTANDPRNVAALRWMASYGKSYDLKKMQSFSTTFGSDQTANGPFFVGKVAMWGTGEWSRDFIKRYAPKLDWGYFPLPSPPGGRDKASVTGGSVFVIPAACQDKEAAWEFLNWMTSPRAVSTFCGEIGNVPPLISVGQEPQFQRDPLMKFAVAVAQSENAFGPPPIPIWPTYAREIGRAEEAAMMAGADPQKQLDALQRQMSREYSRTMRELGRDGGTP